MKKALIAMSGGVDSSVSLFLAKQRGLECTGVMMKLFENDDIGAKREKACCSLEDAEDARNTASSMGVPFYVHNFATEFKEQVISRFINAYQTGATPNPCIECNRYMKFEKLLSRAKQLDMDCFVTGHYARIEKDAESGRYVIKKALDKTKDQSYVLYPMKQEQLAYTLFPLGDLYKHQVREIAEKQGFINAKKSDSQDICFVRDGDYSEFIEQYTGKTYESGNFIDTRGNVLGRHKGLIRYTIGQRKGLGLSAEKPMYVCSKNTQDNTITLCEDNQLYSKSLIANDFNWIAYENLDSPIYVFAKIRYTHTPQRATAVPMPDGNVKVEFDEPQRAIAKGQAVVLYDGDIVVGGGTIM